MDIIDHNENGVLSSQDFSVLIEPENLCFSCGACCAYYRASFYWSEADDFPSGTVPVHLTEKLSDFRRIMIGTNAPNPRCIALSGTIGEEVYCQIYEARSSVCREFKISWDQNIHNPRCDAARLFWGLSPMEPPRDKPVTPGNYPRAA
jgi:Fe-S-cluster containining protein